MYVYVAVSLNFNHQMFVFLTLITQETVSFFFFNDPIKQLLTTDRCIWNTLYWYFEISNLHFTAPSPTRKREKTFIKSTIPRLRGKSNLKTEDRNNDLQTIGKKIINPFKNVTKCWPYRMAWYLFNKLFSLYCTLSLRLLRTYKHWLHLACN